MRVPGTAGRAEKRGGPTHWSNFSCCNTAVSEIAVVMAAETRGRSPRWMTRHGPARAPGPSAPGSLSALPSKPRARSGHLELRFPSGIHHPRNITLVSYDVGTTSKKLVTLSSLLASYFQRCMWTLILDRCRFASIPPS